MTDERMDALIRRLDVPSDPDPDSCNRPTRRCAHGPVPPASGTRVGSVAACATCVWWSATCAKPSSP